MFSVARKPHVIYLQIFLLFIFDAVNTSANEPWKFSDIKSLSHAPVQFTSSFHKQVRRLKLHSKPAVTSFEFLYEPHFFIAAGKQGQLCPCNENVRNEWKFIRVSHIRRTFCPHTHWWKALKTNTKDLLLSRTFQQSTFLSYAKNNSTKDVVNSQIWVASFDTTLFTRLGDWYFGRMGEEGLNAERRCLMSDRNNSLRERCGASAPAPVLVSKQQATILTLFVAALEPKKLYIRLEEESFWSDARLWTHATRLARCFPFWSQVSTLLTSGAAGGLFSSRN